jgi:L-histidine Nalpha-methyltransferase
MLKNVALFEPVSSFAEEVRAGLTKPGQKELPSKYLYDTVGSALFETISVLPEYGLTRADEQLLRRHAEEIADCLSTPIIVAELGCGSGKKTRWILEALSRRQPTQYHPIEISPAALAMCRRELGNIDSVCIVGLEREYLDGLREVADRRETGNQLLVLFLGSTIGNFESPADVRFLYRIRSFLQRGDALLLGTDLLKPIPELVAAYDDPLGVTAAFNLNLLARINRELQGDFNLRHFEHCALFNPRTQSVELHLRSTRMQTVTLAKIALSIRFLEGETIWTESSHKYTRREIFALARHSGFRCAKQWIGLEWQFAENLLVAA